MKKQAKAAKTQKRKKRAFPRGWNERRVREVIAYYDKQTEDEELAEYEASMREEGLTMMLVPTALVPEIRQLIDRRRGA